MTVRRMSIVPTVLFAVVALAACTAAPGTTPAPSAPSATMPSADATSEPEPSAAPAVTCDDVLTAETYTRFEADGIEPIDPPIVVDPFAQQLVEAGALTCTWGAPAAEGLTVVRLSDADSTEWEPMLADAGFVETNDPVPGAYTGPVDPGLGETPIVVVTGDTLTYADNPTVAGWLVPTS
ncbi:hypothetical protein [Agromyces sp. NPDC049794]|uniref:hypothetical protein n=1 Tax=unclassified Agromyces TaxID=2639701 RepID=UPI003402ADDF